MSKMNIVVIGGGYAGEGFINKLDRSLPKTHRIVLVERQEFMYLKIAAARASTFEDLGEKILVTYDRLFRSKDNGVVVRASVTEIKPHSVVLSEPHDLFGPEIEFDYLVIATGSSSNYPIELNTNSRKEALAALAESRAQVARAKDIVIVGANPLGIELAGEIKMANPAATVTIVHNLNLPIDPSYPDYFRKQIVTALAENKIDIILGETVSLKEPVRLSSGRILPADQFVATGASPRGYIINTLSRFIQAQNNAYPNIFAIGDVADEIDVKMTYKADLHAAIVAKNVLSLIRGQTPPAVYTPTTRAEIMVLPIGKYDGVTSFPFVGGFTLGGWVTSMLKGKTLLIDTGRKMLRY